MILTPDTCDLLIEWGDNVWHYSALRLPNGGCVCGRGHSVELSREYLRIGIENLVEGPVQMMVGAIMRIPTWYKTQAIWVGVLGGDPATYACTVNTDGKLIWGRGDTDADARLSLQRELGSAI